MILDMFVDILPLTRDHVAVLGAFGIESTQSGDGVRLGSCLTVADKSAGSKVSLTGCNDTDTKQQWTYTLKGGIIVSGCIC